MFIKSLTIKNYKCFEDETIDFNTPDGNEGSGLNILIGENGNGKTTILESINFIDQSKFLVENALSVNNFQNIEEDIEVILKTDLFNCSLDWPYKGYFECDGINFLVKHRSQKAPGKVLSSPFVIKTEVNNINKNYKKEDDVDSGKEIPALNLLYGNSSIEDALNIFYFDNARSRHIQTSRYKTTFQRIVEDLNWRFIKALEESEDNNSENTLREKIVQDLKGSFLVNATSLTREALGDQVSSQMTDFFESNKFDNLVIDILNFLEPFNNAFWGIRQDDSIHAINISDTGSGMEIILSLLLLKNISEQAKGDIVYLIDEPELHLHPKAQEKLMKLLLQESSDKQIVLATHSPYLLKGAVAVESTGLILLKRNNDEIDIQDARDKNWGLFPWSPSWGEINYFAYDMPTVEFHNELYGYLQSELQDVFNKNINKHHYIGEDQDHENEDAQKDCDYCNKYWNDDRKEFEYVSLSKYIRNLNHHPENTQNSNYTDEELTASIETMINLIHKNDQT